MSVVAVRLRAGFPVETGAIVVRRSQKPPQITSRRFQNLREAVFRIDASKRINDMRFAVKLLAYGF
jgi:hypothetical protein